MHRNSQKRIYEDGATVFITTVTRGRRRYFENSILAELFIRDLWLATKLKKVELFGYTVLPDHVHLLFLPIGAANYSEVMRSLKANFSRDANDVLLDRLGNKALPAGDVAPHRLHMINRHIRFVLPLMRRRFEESSKHQMPLDRFSLQKSFHDHIVRDEHDFNNHMRYIYENAVKHGLVDEPDHWPLMWIDGMKKPRLFAELLQTV